VLALKGALTVIAAPGLTLGDPLYFTLQKRNSTMKTLSTINTLLVSAVLAAVTLTGCKDRAAESTGTTDSATPPTSVTPATTPTPEPAPPPAVMPDTTTPPAAPTDPNAVPTPVTPPNSGTSGTVGSTGSGVGKDEQSQRSR
jgi:hypothetical protein